MNKNLNPTVLKFISIIILGLIVVFSGVRTVPSGEVGVVTRFGRVNGTILDPGLHLIIPFIDKVLVYNTKKVVYETNSEEKQAVSQSDYKDYPVDTNTSDGQPVDIYYTVRFSTDPTKATWIAQNIGNEDSVVEKIVKTESRIWVRNIVREFKADELYTGNVAKVQTAIEERIRPTLANNGLILDSVGIREIKFSAQYVKAIEDKQIEAVKVETEKNRAAQEEYRKQQKITAAEASAKEQDLQRLTISKEILTKMWIEKWDGVLPKTMIGSDKTSSTLLQLPNQ